VEGDITTKHRPRTRGNLRHKNIINSRKLL